MAGASRCFFAFIGFDSVATSAEESADPGRTVPYATLISMATVTLAYILMGSALTLMVPFDQIDPGAAFSVAFALRGWDWARVVVAIGALCGITTALTGHLFTLPRCLDCKL